MMSLTLVDLTVSIDLISFIQHNSTHCSHYPHPVTQYPLILSPLSSTTVPTVLITPIQSNIIETKKGGQAKHHNSRCSSVSATPEIRYNPDLIFSRSRPLPSRSLAIALNLG
ncbi:hypothetical protein RRG08_030089 [Elysia crispata]|uniref:Uncharacterized protein n=1 Tax=Elysia crispata TaxID=231223 RepID=A0AAE0ZRG9_9GAST|nr:hypothetical protein RRG08_030089 [Elysia crispata]